jgi:hypothetical protein
MAGSTNARTIAARSDVSSGWLRRTPAQDRSTSRPYLGLSAEIGVMTIAMP